ncbi:MAG: type III pantothenate kinase [Gammaproteobacteria bacterium]|nr:type III pantothenate kinase [Gammaproteobacteria bacterium]
MKLLLDVGNTAVKWATAESGSLTARGAFGYRDGEFGRLADQAWSGIETPAVVVAVNVAGEGVAASIADYVSETWQCPVELIRTARSACGVTNAYRAPGDLGADRWVAMIAAHRRVDGAVCIVDCGTAITIDLVAASGEHRGGLILPGVRLLGETLAVNTAGIRLQDDTTATGLLGRTTRDGVTRGAQYLVAAAIDRIAADVVEDAGEPVTVIITGGDAERLLPLLATPVQYQPQLVLQGLAILSDREI